MQKAKIDNGTIKYRDELVRKMIHLCSLSIPVIYYFITKTTALKIILPITVLFLLGDLARFAFPPVWELVSKLFGFMLRAHEKDSNKKSFNGATWVLLSASLCMYLFPKVFFITAFSVLIISDTSAALIGRKFGRHRFLSKSFEGTMAFFISACIVVMFAPKISGNMAEYIIGFVSVAIGAIAENISYGFADDNFTIPISVGITMWALYYFFLPQMPLLLVNVPR
jgi:dolichol kinase